MDKKERLRRAFEYQRGKGVLKTQKDLATALGATASNVSKALNGDSNFLTTSFLERFVETFPETSLRWLLTGEGDMLVSGNTATAGNGSNQVVGNNTGHISQTTASDLTTTIADLTDIIKQAQATTITAQAQTNALIAQLSESQAQVTALINLLNAQDRHQP